MGCSGEMVHMAESVLARVNVRGKARKSVLQGRQLFLNMDFLYVMKHQVDISAEWCLFKRRPWPTQVCMCTEQPLVPALSSQSRWKTGN